MMKQAETNELLALLQKTMQEGGQATLTVTSNSMAPLIRRGDQVRIAALKRPLLPGDIITFYTTTGLLTHRFWGYVPASPPSFVLTRGDKPLNFDPPTPADHIVGQVIMRQRHGRWLALHEGRGQWLNRQLAWLAAVDNRVLIGKIPTHQATSLRPAWWRQGIHWVLYTWGRMVTAVLSRMFEKTGDLQIHPFL